MPRPPIRPARSDLPSGTVTLLFSDVQGSTKLLHEIGEAAYSRVLMEHRSIMRDAFAAHGGVEVDTQGDAFLVAFASAPEAVAAARDATGRLASTPIQVRIGLHTGRPQLTGEGYVGVDVHLGARIASAGHGGQVLLSAATRSCVDGDITDLGEHRLKDFARPVAIFQLGTSRFPPLRTIANTNLPRPASTFVGREREIAEIVRSVRSGARLVTLSGPGGTGKTRLAIEVAAELVGDFKAGTFFVDLAPIRDPALVTATVAQVLGATDELAAHIGDREMLLVLDNLEQVLDAGPDLARLLERCRSLRLLVTSRELLRLRGEVERAVRPLAASEAIELFCARAGLPADAAIAAICARLDHLPLAIELAAARVRILSPAQILERLGERLPLLTGGARDLPERQRTLRGTIDWSHDLLDRGEQRLFAALAVFRGGSTLEMAEDVVAADLDTLQSLVEKSLLRREGERFSMLESIHEYASERLDASGTADAVRRRHADRFLALAEEAEPRLAAGERGDWPDRLERDHDNLRAALEHLESTGATQEALRLAGALVDFWEIRGHGPEAWRRLERTLVADTRRTPARAKALLGAANFAPERGDDGLATRLATEALELYGELGDARGVARATFMLALAPATAGDFARARPMLEQSIRLLREAGDEHTALWATRSLAWTCEELGDHERARSLHEENVRRSRAVGDTRTEARSLGALGAIAGEHGRLDEALASLEAAYRLDRELGNRPEIALDLCRLAVALAAAGRAPVATMLLARAEDLRDELGAPYPGWAQRMNERTLAAVRTRLDEPSFSAAWDRGRGIGVDDAVQLALQAAPDD